LFEPLGRLHLIEVFEKHPPQSTFLLPVQVAVHPVPLFIERHVFEIFSYHISNVVAFTTPETSSFVVGVDVQIQTFPAK
jgi:hypothetical protein